MILSHFIVWTIFGLSGLGVFCFVNTIFTILTVCGCTITIAAVRNEEYEKVKDKWDGRDKIMHIIEANTVTSIYPVFRVSDKLEVWVKYDLFTPITLYKQCDTPEETVKLKAELELQYKKPEFID